MRWFVKDVCGSGIGAGKHARRSGSRRALKWLLSAAVGASLLACPAAVRAQASNSAVLSLGPILTPYGTPATNASVRVCPVTAIGTPCSTSGVTLYSDYNLTQPIANPTALNTQGILNVFTTVGYYLIQITPVASQPQNVYTFYAFAPPNVSASLLVQTNSTANHAQNVLNFTDSSTVKFTNPSGGVEEATVVGSSAANYASLVTQPVAGQMIFVRPTGFTPASNPPPIAQCTAPNPVYPSGYVLSPPAGGPYNSAFFTAGSCGNNLAPDSEGGTWTFTGALEKYGLTQAQVTHVYGAEMIGSAAWGVATLDGNCGGGNLVLADGSYLGELGGGAPINFTLQQANTADLGTSTGVDSLTCSTTANHAFVNGGGQVFTSVTDVGFWVEYTGTPVPTPSTVNFAAPLGWYGALNSVWLQLPYDIATDAGTAANVYKAVIPGFIPPGQAANYAPTAQTHFWLFAQNANTGASTLTFNGYGPVSIDKNVNGSLVALAANDIVTSEPAQLMYTGSVWILENPATGNATSVNINGGSTIATLDINGSVPLACPDTSGSGTAQSCTTSPTFTPATNNCIVYTTTTANTGTGLTLDVDALGVKSVAIPGSSGWTTTLTAGIIPANKPLNVCYDGTNWNVQQTGTVAAAGGVTSVSNSDSTLTISPTTGPVVASLNLAHANTWTANQTAPAFVANGGAGQGGTLDATEGTSPTATAGHDILYADSTAHCLELSNNGAAFACIGSGGTGLSGMTAGQVPIAATATTVTSSKALAGTGAGITTGPTTTTLNDCVKFGDTAGTIADAGAACGSGGGGGAPGPYSYTFTVSGTLSLLTSGSGGSGYTGTPTCTLVGGQLVSGTADTCTVTLTSGALSYSLSGTGVYSNPPTLTFGGVTGGTGAVAPPIGLGSETVNAYNNTTQSTTPAFTGTDAAVVVNDVTNALAQTGGTLYFKPGWYSCNSATAETITYTTVYYCFDFPATSDGYNAPIFKVQGESAMTTNYGVSTSGGGVTFYVSSAATTAANLAGGVNILAAFWARVTNLNWNIPPFNGAFFVGAHVQINNVQIIFPDNTLKNERAVDMLAASFLGLDSVSAGFATHPTALGQTDDIAFETNGADSDGAILTNLYSETGWDIGYALNTEHTVGTNIISEENTTGINYGFEKGINNQQILHGSALIHPILGEDVNGITFGTQITSGASIDILNPDFETWNTTPWTTSSFINGSTSISGTISNWYCHNSGGGTSCPTTTAPYSIFTTGSYAGFAINEYGQYWGGGSTTYPSTNTTAISGTTSTSGPAVLGTTTNTAGAIGVQATCNGVTSGGTCRMAASVPTAGYTEFGYKVGATQPGYVGVGGSNTITFDGNNASVPAGSFTIPAGTLTIGGSTYNPGANIISATGDWVYGTDFAISNTSSGGHAFAFDATGSSSGLVGAFAVTDTTEGTWPFTAYCTSASACETLQLSGGNYAFSTTASGGLSNANQNAGISSPGSAQLSMDSTTEGNGLATVKTAGIIPGVLYSAAGTALPTCAAGIQGERAVVSDATTPTYMGAYTSGGAITAAVICSYNGTTYSWLTH